MYYNTTTSGVFLDVATLRDIPKDQTDNVFTIDATYNLRPDLLSFDLYGTSALWWVFAMRNPDTLKDPLFDFRTGTVIYIPSKYNISQRLGI